MHYIVCEDSFSPIYSLSSEAEMETDYFKLTGRCFSDEIKGRLKESRDRFINIGHSISIKIAPYQEGDFVKINNPSSIDNGQVGRVTDLRVTMWGVLTLDVLVNSKVKTFASSDIEKVEEGKGNSLCLHKNKRLMKFQTFSYNYCTDCKKEI